MKNILISILIGLGISVAAFAQSGDPLPTDSRGIPVITGTVPTNGTSEVQTLTLSSTATGSYRVAFAGATSSLVTVTGTDSNSTIGGNFQTAIAAIPTINGTSNCVVTTGTAIPVVMTLTYGGNLAKKDVPQMTGTVVSGSATLSGTTTTPGVTADGRAAKTGQLLIDIGTPDLYINTSKTILSPTWTKVQSQP